MSEARFEQLFQQYGKRVYLHRLTDTKEVTGFNRRPTKTKEQPADYVVTHDGEMFYAEVKESANATSFPFGNIRQGQLAAARRQRAAGGNYFFFILRTATGEWFRVRASLILDWPRKSMTWVELANFRIN